MEAKETKRIKPGLRVERNIDGDWFPARVIAVDAATNSCTLRYLDDNNDEADVPFEEVRELLDKEISARPKTAHALPRPLQGLIEDDEETRKTHQPKVTIHSEHELPEDAIIISGPETAIPTGSGLRGIRWLRKGQP